MDDIKKWIADGRHWDPGKALLELHSGNYSLKKYFKTCNPTNDNQDLLLYELKKLCDAPVSDVVEENDSDGASLLSEEIKPDAESTEEVAAEIGKLNEEWKWKYKELAGLNMKLAHFRTDDERRVAAFKILDLYAKCREIWKHIAMLKKTGMLLPVVVTDSSLPDNAGELLKQRNNLRSRVSKAKLKIKKGDEKKQLKQQALIDGWLIEISLIEKKLKQLGIN